MDGRRYNNTKNVSGVDLIVSTSEEDFEYSNRLAEVISVPIGYDGDINTGDTLLVHHNVFKFYNDMKGKSKSSRSFFKDDIFFVDSDQFYAYNKNGKWYSHDRYVIIKPLKSKNKYLSTSKYEPLHGVVHLPNKYLLSKGLTVGSVVLFKPDSEYEFNIDDEMVYRMFDHQIIAEI